MSVSWGLSISHQSLQPMNQNSSAYFDHCFLVWNVTLKLVNSCRGFREYSTMEDHAIVAWISNGSRARCVNGNRVWRDFQEQYARLTGVGECFTPTSGRNSTSFYVTILCGNSTSLFEPQTMTVTLYLTFRKTSDAT